MNHHHQGMLFVATNIAREDEADFNRWYDHEHVAERVAIPGFLCGTRYRARQAQRRYLGLYQTSSLDVFSSPGYRAAFARQTPWSVANLNRMVDPQRRVCRIEARVGQGRGAHLAVLTCAGNTTTETCQPLGEALSTLPGFVTSALLTPHSALSTPLPNEARATSPLSPMLMIEASSEAAIEALAQRAADTLAAAVEFYCLSWQLTAQESA